MVLHPEQPPRMKLERLNILIFSLEPWHQMWYSKHNFAAELAKSHKVYLISPPAKWNPLDFFSNELELRNTPENVMLVNYRHHFPVRLLPRPWRRRAFRSVARRLGQLINANGTNIIWLFHPSPIAIQPPLSDKGIKFIYHVVDPYQSFEADLACARRADLVVAVNPWFHDKYAPINPNVIIIPHGVRREGRVRDQEKELNYRNKWGTYVIMAGAIDHRLDYGLLLAIVEEFPGLNLVLAGSWPRLDTRTEKLRDRLAGAPNVHFTGVQPPDELRHIIGGAMAGLVCYHFQPYSDKPDRPYGSMKPLIYLAQMKPVISSVNCHLPGLHQKAVYKAENQASFLKLVGQAARGDLALDTSIVSDFLNQVDYGSQATQILNDLLSPELHR